VPKLSSVGCCYSYDWLGWTWKVEFEIIFIASWVANRISKKVFLAYELISVAWHGKVCNGYSTKRSLLVWTSSCLIHAPTIVAAFVLVPNLSRNILIKRFSSNNWEAIDDWTRQSWQFARLWRDKHTFVLRTRRAIATCEKSAHQDETFSPWTRNRSKLASIAGSLLKCDLALPIFFQFVVN